jgi:hypothetical protein
MGLLVGAVIILVLTKGEARRQAGRHATVRTCEPAQVVGLAQPGAGRRGQGDWLDRIGWIQREGKEKLLILLSSDNPAGRQSCIRPPSFCQLPPLRPFIHPMIIGREIIPFPGPPTKAGDTIRSDRPTPRTCWKAVAG